MLDENNVRRRGRGNCSQERGSTGQSAGAHWLNRRLCAASCAPTFSASLPSTRMGCSPDCTPTIPNGIALRSARLFASAPPLHPDSVAGWPPREPPWRPCRHAPDDSADHGLDRPTSRAPTVGVRTIVRHPHVMTNTRSRCEVSHAQRGLWRRLQSAGRFCFRFAPSRRSAVVLRQSRLASAQSARLPNRGSRAKTGCVSGAKRSSRRHWAASQVAPAERTGQTQASQRHLACACASASISVDGFNS